MTPRQIGLAALHAQRICRAQEVFQEALGQFLAGLQMLHDAQCQISYFIQYVKASAEPSRIGTMTDEQWLANWCPGVEPEPAAEVRVEAVYRGPGPITARSIMPLEDQSYWSAEYPRKGMPAEQTNQGDE